MTVGQILAMLALVIIGLMLWVARQARIVREDVQGKRMAMETSDRAREQRARRNRRPAKWTSRERC